MHFEKELDHILTPMGLSLHDLVLPGKSGGVFKVFVDHPEGVGLDQLETVSRRISDLLDVLDPFPGKYRLEVSSPGLDRILRVPEDLLIHLGKHIKVKTMESLQGQRVFRGIIESVQDGVLLISSTEGKKQIRHSIPLGIVAEARAEFWLDAVSGNSRNPGEDPVRLTEGGDPSVGF
ncbi:MAG: ribosome maturation factor RimP [Nitrospirae bacterium]|nr:ribosome maturation factor RimP [Nitrospirota bacterium]